MITRRNMLKALGVGGLLPFVRGDELKAAPLEVEIPQEQPISESPGTEWYTPGSFEPRPYIGSASFSVDGVNWHKLGNITAIDYERGIIIDGSDGGDE